MSAEVVTIKKMAKALQKIARLSELDVGKKEYLYDGENGADEITREVKLGLDYAARIAKEALKGIIVT
ncbi:hypothetical protein LCGC14_2473550 [marine sediment metagenome]|uniref:Uncharacterized protein n=1 Tax=marine sediment metagenome TaxID=412755 RepID=A0A0F9BAB8_9ZZZZ